MTEYQQTGQSSGDQDFASKTQQTAEQLKNAAVEQVEKVRTQADSAKEHAVERIRRVGSALKSAGDGLQQDDELAARYAARAAERIEHVADYLGSVEPRALIRDAEQLARSKPALFFGGAFLVGLAAGRFLRASSNTSNGGSGSDEEWQARSIPLPEGSSESSSTPASPKRKSPRRRPGSQESSSQRTPESGLGSSIEEPLR
jgi:hypothetical protein